jgi:hypothetical protein
MGGGSLETYVGTSHTGLCTVSEHMMTDPTDRDSTSRLQSVGRNDRSVSDTITTFPVHLRSRANGSVVIDNVTTTTDPRGLCSTGAIQNPKSNLYQ